MKLFSIFLAFVFLYISCNDQSNRNAIDEKSLPKNFSGTFTGVIPCADCPGIELTVSFNPDSSFSELMIYQERNTTFKDSGLWIKDGEMLEVKYSNAQATPRYFLIKSDSSIAWLDADRKEIEGPHGEHYVLKRK